MQAPITRSRGNRQVLVATLIIASVATAAIMLAASPAIKLLGATAQARPVFTKTVNAARQSAGIACNETRLAAAFAFNDKTALKAKCGGTVNRDFNRYVIVTATGIFYLTRKFYSPSYGHWRITVEQRP
jgi:hypothetical protein